MCGFIRVLGARRVGGIPDGDKASFQHHRDVVAGLVLETRLGEVEVGAGVVRFPGG